MFGLYSFIRIISRIVRHLQKTGYACISTSTLHLQTFYFSLHFLTFLNFFKRPCVVVVSSQILYLSLHAHVFFVVQVDTSAVTSTCRPACQTEVADSGTTIKIVQSLCLVGHRPASWVCIIPMLLDKRSLWFFTVFLNNLYMSEWPVCVYDVVLHIYIHTCEDH